MAKLDGMKSICDYEKRSEATMLKLIREEDYPAKKIGGIWQSDTGVIEKWRKERISNGE